MNKKSPAITVLMSVFNGARWLEEAIASVLAQTFTDFEFIIVDDGSTDSSPEIIKEYQSKDPRVVVIKKQNSGLADSLNIAIQRARGEWIARIDADDLCRPMRLEKQYAIAQARADLVLIGSSLQVIDEQGFLGKTYSFPLEHHALLNNLINVKNFFAHSSAFYRTEAVRAVGGYRARIKRAQDIDLWLRLSEIGTFASVDEALVLNRVHQEQISNDDGGRLQKIYSRVARAGFYLRNTGFPDPVDGDIIQFETFRGWIEKRMSEIGFFEYHDSVTILKQLLIEKRISVRRIFEAAKIILNPHFVYSHLRHRLVGEKLPKELANEWLLKEKQDEILNKMRPMRELVDSEVRLIQLNILKDLINVCNTYDIGFMLYYGSLLGAVRHSGYIPWDDDIDVCMIRSDYEKLFTIDWDEINLRLVSSANDPSMPYPFVKISRTGTQFIEEIDGPLIDMGVNIDVVPIDAVPNNAFARFISNCLIGLTKSVYILKVIKPNDQRAWLKNVVIFITKWFMSPVSPNLIGNLWNKLARSYSINGAEFVACRVDYYGFFPPIFPRSHFYSVEYVLFENIEVPIPVRYHDILNKLYGDYMTPPPPQNRFSNHAYRAFIGK